MIRISEVDGADETTLRAFWEVEQASQRHDREHAVLRSWDRLQTLARGGNEYYARTFLVARDGDGVVGAAETVRGVQDNLHFADLAVNVLPGRRREGIGRALYDEAMGRLVADGRTSVCGEVYVSGGDWPGTPAYHLEAEPVVFDVERLRAGEQRTARSFHSITAAARRLDDAAFGGYSLLYLPHGADYIQQDETLVMPEHRGHRLGTLLKCATLEIAQREHPERVAIHTDTAVDNHAMQATNRHFGYRPVERLLEMQRRDG